MSHPEFSTLGGACPDLSGSHNGKKPVINRLMFDRLQVVTHFKLLIYFPVSSKS